MIRSLSGLLGALWILASLLLFPAPAALAAGAEDIALETVTGTLYATLDVPAGRETFPAVLVIPGSGPTDRDGNTPLLAGKNNSLQMIGTVLTDGGMAALRIDKRGVAASMAAVKDEASLIFENYIEDAVAWVARLRADPRITQVAVLGHSEGSLVGMVAAHRAGADAFVSVAGAGQPIDRILIEQLSAQPGGLPDATRHIITELKAGRTVGEVPAAAAMLFRASVQPYLINWMTLDPTVEISKLKMPVLILQGDRDSQIKIADAELLKAAQPAARLVIVPTMNHVLKSVDPTPAANIAAYGDPSLPLAPGFGEALLDFLGEAFAAGGRQE